MVREVGLIVRYYLRVPAFYEEACEVAKVDYVTAATREGLNAESSFTGICFVGSKTEYVTTLLSDRPGLMCANCGYRVMEVLEQWNSVDPVTGSLRAHTRTCWRHTSSRFIALIGALECKNLVARSIAQPRK